MVGFFSQEGNGLKPVGGGIIHHQPWRGFDKLNHRTPGLWIPFSNGLFGHPLWKQRI